MGAMAELSVPLVAADPESQGEAAVVADLESQGEAASHVDGAQRHFASIMETKGFKLHCENALKTLSRMKNFDTFTKVEKEVIMLMNQSKGFTDEVVKHHSNRITKKLEEMRKAKSTGSLLEGRRSKEELSSEIDALRAFHLLPPDGTLTFPDHFPYICWPNLLYAFQTYAMMMAMVMGIAIFNGEMMSFFLFVMANVAEPSHSKPEKTWYWTLLASVPLPFFLFLGCLCIFNCVCLLTGQISSVSFARCRAMMACAMMKLRRSVSAGDDYSDMMKKTCWWIDFWFVNGFLISLVVFTLAAAGLSAYWYGEHLSFGAVFSAFSTMWKWPMIFVLIWAFLTILVYILCDAYNSIDALTRWRTPKVQTALVKYNIRPGCMEGKYILLHKWADLQYVKAEDEDKAKAKTEHACKGGVLAAIAFTLAVLKVLEASGIFRPDPEIRTVVLMCAWISFALVSIAYFCRTHFPKLMHAPFFIGIVLLAVIICLLLVGGLKMVPLISGRPVPVPMEHGPGAWVYENLDLGTRQTGRQHIPYPACFMQWGQGTQMKVLDLAILSSYSYDAEASSYLANGEAWNATMASFAGKGLSVEILVAQDYFTVGRVVAFRFLQEGAAGGTIVLVVKGSSEAFDFYADAGLWAGIASFQVFMILIPLLDQLPNSLFVWLLKRLPSTNNHVFSNVHEVYESLAQNPRYANDSFMITGHSLGGGIATAAGGSLGIPAVSFSGPGSHFSRHRFGTTQEQAYRSALTIKPEMDFIHKIDRHDDMSQYIDCRDASGAYRSFATCHSISTTVCELWRSCGDHRGRDFRQMCSGLVNNINLTGTFLGRPA